MNNNKYHENTNNKYLTKKTSLVESNESNIIQKRMFAKTSADSSGFNWFTGGDFTWFDGRKFSDVKKDPYFIQNASKLNQEQLDRYLDAAKEYNTSLGTEYEITAPVPDLTTTDISKNPSWYKQYAFDSAMRESYVNDFLKDWKTQIPAGVEATREEADKIWQHQVNQSWDKFISDRGGNYDDIYNPMGIQDLIPNPDRTWGNRDENSQNNTQDGGSRNNNSNQNNWYDPENPRGYGWQQNSDDTKIGPVKPKNFTYTYPSDSLGFKSNKIIFPGEINPKRLPIISQDPHSPFGIKLSPKSEFTGTYVDDPLAENFYYNNVYVPKTLIGPVKPDKIKKPKEIEKPKEPSWWDKLLNLEFLPKPPKKLLPNLNTGFPPRPGEKPEIPDISDDAIDAWKDTNIGKRAKKRGSMNKMMGGKSGRMGPEIKDDDGTTGRYFQKKAKRKPVTTYKFYETDKPHGPQMQSMQQNMLTKAQMINAKKMHEINDANYYGVEKPMPKNTFRKNSMSMGNSINMGGASSSSLMPRKNSYSIDTPRQKTPSPMSGMKHNPFFKPAGGSLKTYNPYPRSGGMATGMPPTMSGGFSTAKRMTKRATKPQSVRSKYGC